MTRQPEHTPTQVAASRSKPVGDACSAWLHAKPWVWTERMLTALEQGVKGGKWFSLIDKIYHETTLFAAAQQVTAKRRKAAGVDHVTPEHFARDLPKHVVQLAEQLRNGTYVPNVVRRTWIDKPGKKEKRPLGIPTVRDRVVQTAVRDVIEPIFEADFAEHSYGFRPGRGCRDALRRVDALLKAGYTYAVDVDLKSYFETIPHDNLLARISEKISDGRVLALIESFLTQGVMDGASEWTPEQGSPQGAVISPLLSNIYLNPLDHLVGAKFEMVRYADDIVILCRGLEEAKEALAVVQAWTAEAGLTLHPEKTKIVDACVEGVEFLGYCFKRGERFPRGKSVQQVRNAIREVTRRANGHSLGFIIFRVSNTLRGWFEYFKHVTKVYVFDTLDKWVRMRLRSVLRKRRKRRGRGRGGDHVRWPNAFFAERGLFNLKAAHAAASQSPPG